MIEQIKNYISDIPKDKSGWIIQLVEYININYPTIDESFKYKMPTYNSKYNYLAFACQKNYFSFYTHDKNVLSVLASILPKAKLGKGCIRIKYSQEYALHAMKVAINYAFNPNKVTYTNILKAKFIDRPNRFISNIDIDGEQHICHVKNTGRCKELLIEGCTIYVKKHSNPKRKTDYSLISVQKGNRLINMDSQVPNKAVYKWLMQQNLFDDIEYIKPEYKYHNSRIDFFIKTKTKKILLEVKGVTLETDGVAMFPDAPTERGVTHIKELIKAKDEGYESYIFFVIQMDNIKYFTPNEKTHPAFKEALVAAKEKNVQILAYDCIVTLDSISINNKCQIVL